MVKYRYEQEKSRVILKDLLIMFVNMLQATCKHKGNYLIYSPINILSSQHF